MLSQFAQPAAERTARRILLAAVVVQVAVFGVAMRAQFKSLLSPGGAIRLHAGRTFFDVVDCHGYYAWLRSPLIDGDWDFANEYRFYESRCPGNELHYGKTPTGRTANQWSVGPALVWSATVVPVHFALNAAGVESTESQGYAPPYQLAVGLVTLALSLATLLFAYRIARVFAPPVAAAVAAAVVVLGTSIVGYGTVEVGMAHGPATAALAAYVWVWLRTFGSARFGRWFVLGVLLGIACLMRWQLATFAILPALEAAWLVRENWRLMRPVVLSVCGALGALVGFIPQMVAWWVVYGRPLVNPHPTKAEWFAPSFWQVLGSPDRSLFYWTPAALVGVLGLLAASRPGREESLRARFLLIAVAIQVYLMAAIIDRGVCLGYSLGFRFLTETAVVLVAGLAVVFRRAAPRWPVSLALGCGVVVGWNLILTKTAANGMSGYETPAGLLTAVRVYFYWRGREGVFIIALAVVFTICLTRELFACRATPEMPTLAERGLLAALGRLIRGLRSGTPR
jgi:hypothetical protein